MIFAIANLVDKNRHTIGFRLYDDKTDSIKDFRHSIMKKDSEVLEKYFYLRLIIV